MRKEHILTTYEAERIGGVTELKKGDVVQYDPAPNADAILARHGIDRTKSDVAAVVYFQGKVIANSVIWDWE